MLRTTVGAIILTLGLTGSIMAQQRIFISSDWGNVTVELAENEAARSLVSMLPVTIAMRLSLPQNQLRTYW